MGLLDVEEPAWGLSVVLSRYVSLFEIFNVETDARTDAVAAGVIPSNIGDVYNYGACNGY